MKDLIKQYLDNGMSRRQLMTGLSALGMSAVAAKSVAQSLETFGQGAAAPPASAMREMKGTGGALFVQQLKAAGVEHIFFNPSTGDYPIFDALVDEPAIQLIKGIHEGAVVAMADGYARASGKTGVVIVANIGLPNAMTQMVNSWKDQIPVMVAVASVEQDALGRDLFQEPDHCEVMTQPITKWYWAGEDDGLDPGDRPPRHEVRLDVALRPGVPVAADQYAARGSDRHHLGPGEIRRADADPARQGRHREGRAHSARSQEPADERRRRGHLVPRRQGAGRARRAARPSRHRAGRQPRLLVEAVPDAASALCRHAAPRHALSRQGRRAAEPRQQVRRARRAGNAADLHPPRSREPCPRRAGRSRHGRRRAARHRRSDGGDPIDGDARRGSSRSPRSAPPAPAPTPRRWREFRQKIARENADRTPVSLERIGLELEAALDKDTCYVCDVDSGKTIDPLLSFGGADKQYIGTGPNVLGWGMAAAFGAKLARPDLPVVSVVGDGSFCFSGPQPLWTQARYKAPVMNIVLNNHSYNNERNRIWHYGGRQFRTGRDMTCYLGSPDIDYAKASEAFGVEAEVVKEPGKLKGAIARAQRAVADGRPYLLDIHTYRDGLGAVSTWHPPYSIADLRSRKV